MTPEEQERFNALMRGDAQPGSLRDQAAEAASRIAGTASRVAPWVGVLSNPATGITDAAGNAFAAKILGKPTESAPETVSVPAFTRPANDTVSTPSFTRPAGPSQAAPMALTAPSVGGGAGGGGGLAALKKQSEDAQNNYLGTFDTQKGLTEQLGQQKVDEANANAAQMDAAGAWQAQQAQQEEQLHAQAKAQTDAAMAKQQQMADEIAQQKPDLKRVFRNMGTAERVGWGVAAALDGWLGVQTGKGGNDALDRLDKMVDRDIDAQAQELNNKKTALSSQQSLVGQLMQQSGNEAIARQQARSLMWDSIKSYMGAMAQRNGSPQIMTSAKLAGEEIDQRQAGLKATLANDLYDTTYKQAAAGVAAQRAAQQKIQDRLDNLTEKLVMGDAQNAPMSPDQARAAALATFHGEGAVRGAGYTGPLAPTQRTKEGAEKDARAMTVVIGGKEMPALSTNAAEEWRKFSDGRRNFEQSLKDMRAAAEAGDPARYNTARGILLDTAPKLLGFSRGPSEGQLQTTFGPLVVPEYNHWYNPANLATAGVAYPVKQDRNSRQLDVLQQLLDNSTHTMVENTVGKPSIESTGAKAK